VLPPLVTTAALAVGIQSGRASGVLDVVAGGGRAEVMGTLTIDDLKTAPAAGDRPEHVLACKRIEIAIERAELPGLRADLSRVGLEWPYVFVDRTAAGLFPLTLGSGPGTAEVRSPSGTIRIDDVSVTGGRVDFRDEMLTPPYWRSLASVTLRARDVSATPVSIPRVLLDGLVDELSPLRVEGTIGARTELRVDAKQVALPPFNVYLEDVSSYSVSSGLAEVRSEIVIERSALEATKRVVLSRLGVQGGDGRGDTLKQQIGLPLTLAIALMKDYRGNIALALPVRGDLASPTFSLRSAVWQAVVQAIKGAVLSPLNALGRVLLRDGRIERFDLEPIPFPPGSRVLDATGTARVAQVARVLQTRPDLALAIRGTLAPDDLEPLQATPALAALEASGGPDALRGYLRARLADEAPPTLSPEDRSRLDTLVRGLPWPAGGAQALAVDRGQIVAATLAVEHGLDGSRFQVAPPAVDPSALAPAPGAVLSLQGR
jgi:hypothetical protein